MATLALDLDDLLSALGGETITNSNNFMNQRVLITAGAEGIGVEYAAENLQSNVIINYGTDNRLTYADSFGSCFRY